MQSHLFAVSPLNTEEIRYVRSLVMKNCRIWLLFLATGYFVVLFMKWNSERVDYLLPYVRWGSYHTEDNADLYTNDGIRNIREISASRTDIAKTNRRMVNGYHSVSPSKRVVDILGDVRHVYTSATHIHPRLFRNMSVTTKGHKELIRSQSCRNCLRQNIIFNISPGRFSIIQIVQLHIMSIH